MQRFVEFLEYRVTAHSTANTQSPLILYTMAVALANNLTDAWLGGVELTDHSHLSQFYPHRVQ